MILEVEPEIFAINTLSWLIYSDTQEASHKVVNYLSHFPGNAESNRISL